MSLLRNGLLLMIMVNLFRTSFPCLPLKAKPKRNHHHDAHDRPVHRPRRRPLPDPVRPKRMPAKQVANRNAVVVAVVPAAPVLVLVAAVVVVHRNRHRRHRRPKWHRKLPQLQPPPHRLKYTRPKTVSRTSDIIAPIGIRRAACRRKAIDVGAVAEMANVAAVVVSKSCNDVGVATMVDGNVIANNRHSD